MRIRRAKGLVAAMCCLGLVLMLSGCGNARRALGIEKQAPDEFSVVTRAPLTIPPDYGLRPPAPGTNRPQEQTTREDARRILIGAAAGKTTPAPPVSSKFSRGESALLKQAGALNPDPGIRLTVNRESTALAKAEDSLVNKLLFWQEAEPAGVVVDAEKESRRLREASALGDAPTKGETPVIKRKEKGWLEGIF